VAVGCRPSTTPATQALDAFVALASRDGLSYRFTMIARPEGGGQASHGEGVVVGRDSVLTATFVDPGDRRTSVIKGDRVFEQTGDGAWEVRARRGVVEGNDTSFLLPLVAGADLGAGETLSFEGQTVYQLASRAPIEVPGDNVLTSQTIPRVEVLVDGQGRPVRLVAEFEAGPDGTVIGVIEMRFSEFGAPLTVDAPDIP
jgi:hypothetical protein